MSDDSRRGHDEHGPFANGAQDNGFAGHGTDEHAGRGGQTEPGRKAAADARGSRRRRTGEQSIFSGADSAGGYGGTADTTTETTNGHTSDGGSRSGGDKARSEGAAGGRLAGAREQLGERVAVGRAWINEDPRHLALAVGLIFLSIFVAYIVGTTLFSPSAEQTQRPAPQGGPANPEGESAEGGIAAAEDVGEVAVTSEDGEYVIAAEPGGHRYTGTLEENSETSASLALSGPSQASFTSVFTENGARSWMGMLKDSSGVSGAENMVIEATQTSDPGTAATDGTVPLLRGSYVAKGKDGGVSASGTYTDELVDESTIRRTYEETYLLSGAEPAERSWTVEFRASGDISLVPYLVGYKPPPESGDG